MREFSPVAGRLAESRAGRDKGRAFVILSQEKDGRVLVADGDLRKIGKPKCKKLMHLKLRPVVFQSIARLYAGGKLKDSDIRKALSLAEHSDDEPIKEDTACRSRT